MGRGAASTRLVADGLASPRTKNLCGHLSGHLIGQTMGCEASLNMIYIDLIGI
jgi:hypothetical protein